MKKGSEKSRKKCSACGTSPVSHSLARTESIIDHTVGTMGDVCFGWISHVVKPNDLIYRGIESGLNFFFRSIGVLRYSNDISRTPSGRSRLIWEEAIRRNIPMQQAIAFGKPLEYYRAKVDGSWHYFQSLPIPPWMNQAGYEWLDDKFILKKKLSGAGIPAPRVNKIPFWKNPASLQIHLSAPVIIKPQSGSRGRHTTTNIRNDSEFKSAVRLGRKITPWLVEEEHLFGSVYRATIVGGILAGFFRADPPRVTGDGTKTIQELVAEKNAARNERLSEILLDEDALAFLERQDLSPTSVLKAGTTVDLSAKTGRMYGGYTKEMLGEIHPKLTDILSKAGAVVGVGVAGFDLIIEDPTQDPDLQRWGIIECNSLPFIDLHYYALEGTVRDLSPLVWDLWKKA